MATLISKATGNLTSSSTWNKVAANGLLESTGSTTALSTSNLDSSTFVLGATAVDAVALKLASRAAGSPSNTITVTLRNSTAGTNPLSLTINVSDLPACDTTNQDGGWIVFAFGSSHTPNGTDSYLIRVALNSTSTAVSLYTNGTANNWARMVRETTTQAPTTGDNMIVAGEHTGAGTGNDFVVTQDSTAATDYGSASTSVHVDALAVCKRGTFKSGTTAATNYVLRLSGNCQAYSGSTFALGDGSTQIPRDSSSILEFDCGADGDFGLYLRNGSTATMRGLSRTSAKDIVATKLTADAASSATSLTVADDTGWLNGDEIAIASTTQTASQHESRTLNANAGASSLSISSGLTNAHGGTASSKVQAEIILLTRNVKVRSVSSSNMSFVYVGPTVTPDFQWVEFRYIGTGGSTKAGLYFDCTTAFTCRYCVIRDGERGGFMAQNSAHDGWTIRDCTVYNVRLQAFFVAATSGTTYTLRDVISIGGGADDYMIYLNDMAGTFTNLTVTSATTSIQLRDTAAAAWTIDGLVSHSNTGLGLNAIAGVGNGTISNLYFWRNSSYGMSYSGRNHDITLNTGRFFGQGIAAIVLPSATWGSRFLVKAVDFSGDSTFATTHGVFLDTQSYAVDWRFEGCTFGVASGIYVTHTQGDITFFGSQQGASIVCVNCLLSSSNELKDFTFANGVTPTSYVAFQSHDQTSGDDQVKTPVGTLSKETTTVDVSPSMKMVPLHATIKLESNAGIRGRGFLARVSSGQSKTLSVKVQKDGSYNGNAPRLVLKANPSIGITADTVLDTLSVGSGTWETLSGATASASADGVFEFVVDCDGTAGAIYVDTPGVS